MMISLADARGGREVKIPEEFRLSELIRRSASRGEGVYLGIGDDAAVVRPGAGDHLLSCDMLLEDVHFRLRWTSADDLGWKALAVNLSDIAAMGGKASHALLSLGLGKRQGEAFLRGFLRGFKACARRYGVSLVGGDLCRSKRGVVVNVTLVGEAGRGRAKRRGAARRGQLLALLGAPGESACGLDLLKRRVVGHAALKRAHLRPRPLLEAGAVLGASSGVGAVIDISDGLSSELHHLARASGVGCELSEKALPISATLARGAAALRRAPLAYALHGGEGYQLLFSVAAKALPRLVRALAHRHIPVARVVGRCTARRGVALVGRDGRRKELPWGGYSHFLGKGR